MQELVRDRYPDSIFVSALAEGGLEPLMRSLVTRVRMMRPVTEVRIPAGDGRLLAELHREGEVIDQRSEDSVLVLHVRATEALIGRLRRGGATVS
jgi:GTPase